MLWILGHYRANIAAFGSLPAELMSTKGSREYQNTDASASENLPKTLSLKLLTLRPPCDGGLRTPCGGGLRRRPAAGLRRRPTLTRPPCGGGQR